MILPPLSKFDIETFPVLLCTNSDGVEILDLSLSGIAGRKTIPDELKICAMTN